MMFRDMYQVDKECREVPQILGRPITLEDVLILLGKNTRQANEIGIVMLENGNLYVKRGSGGFGSTGK